MRADDIALAKRRLDRSAAAWQWFRWGVRTSLIAAIALPLVALATRIIGAGNPAALGWESLALVLALVIGYRLSITSVLLVARHLDRRLPELEDSCELLLREPSSLNPIEGLQARKVAETINDLPQSSLTPDRSGTLPLLALCAAILVSFFIASWPESGRESPSSTPVFATDRPDPPSVIAVGIEVESPAYSRQEKRQVDGLHLDALPGSLLTWSIETSGPVSAVDLIYLDSRSHSAIQTAPGIWQATLALDTAFLYEIHLSCDASPCGNEGPARIGLLADDSPSIRILEPPRVLVLDPGHATRLQLEVELHDDYGLSHASLVWTLATGSGESVRFRERRRPLAQIVDAPRELRLETKLDLAEIGLEEGAELYYYVEAYDARMPQAQLGRSTTHLLRKPGGESTIQVATLPLDIDMTPRFLRSQRQIILDTEALIAASPGLEEADLKSRSHALAFDQRALRMRYANLLGDEFSSGQIGGDQHDESGESVAEHEDHDHNGEADPSPNERSPIGNPGSLLAALPPGFVHMHDSEQSGSMLAGSVQEKLRDTIAEMFEAERLLAAYDPPAALPAEYRALRKLKEAQEADRLHVRRVGFMSSPLEPEERRFQGELHEIRDRRREEMDMMPTGDPVLLQSLKVLEAWQRDGQRPETNDSITLSKARQLATERVLRSNDIPMEGLRALDEIASTLDRSQPLACDDCLQIAIRALRLLLPHPPSQPHSRSALSKLEIRYRETRP